MSNSSGTVSAKMHYNIMDKAPLAILFLLLALGGGAVGSSLFGPAVVPVVDSATLVADNSELDARVDTLQREVDKLVGQLSLMNEQLAANSGRPLDDPRGGGRRGEPLAGGPGGAMGGPAVMMGGASMEREFEAYLQQRDANKTAEREIKRAEQRKERASKQALKAQEKYGLDEYQTSVLEGALLAKDEARSKAFTEMRESGSFDREQMRETMTDIRETELNTLSSAFTAEQMSQYEADTESRGFGGRGSRDSGGNSGGDRSGGRGRNLQF